MSLYSMKSACFCFVVVEVGTYLAQNGYSPVSAFPGLGLQVTGVYILLYLTKKFHAHTKMMCLDGVLPNIVLI